MLFSNLGITEEEVGVPNAGGIVYTEINLNIELVLSLMIRSVIRSVSDNHLKPPGSIKELEYRNL